MRSVIGRGLLRKWKKNYRREEKDIQNAILEWCRLKGVLAWPVQNQGQYDPAKKCYRRAPKYFVHGIPDIEICLPKGLTIRVEVKSSVGKLSEAQLKFQDKLIELGHMYILARSVKDVSEIVNQLEKLG